MNIFQLRDRIIEKLKEKRDDFQTAFDREEEMLRVERIDNGKGLDIALSKAVDKAKKDDKFVDEVVYYIDETLERMKEGELTLDENAIYPVVRSTSFHKETKSGLPFITDDHTNETNIYYALDFEKSYRLIDEELLNSLGIDKAALKKLAWKNLEKLPISYKKDTIQENDFYFINHNDGYDATRILNDAFLGEMYHSMEGEMMVGLPHQDVLIIADVKNNVGYDVMAQMMMQYFAEGLTPITSLSFSYDGDKLQPVFILGKQQNNKRGREE
ncbi:DUF1444 domain-containing protein [Salinicoccus jeotgali]|uniref:DUF1444 domain-containing protein n=1 Tax=Salinicoccus jeotgali TaxID=381634 RepID=A0ABP7EXF0_9STAP